MYIDEENENLIYERDRTLVVEKGFKEEAIKQVGQTQYYKNHPDSVLDKLASY